MSKKLLQYITNNTQLRCSDSFRQTRPYLEGSYRRLIIFLRNVAHKKLGKQIRHLRTKKKVTLEQMSKALGLSNPAYLSRVESKEEIPSPKLLLKIAKYLDFSIKELFEIARNQKADELKQNVDKRYKV